MHLVELWEKCSSCAGFCIELGERFFNDGVTEVDGTLIPLLKSKADISVSPRVIPSYAYLLWFAQQVCINVLSIYAETGSMNFLHALL